MRPELSDLTYNIQPMERSPYKAYSGEYKPYIWDAIGAMNERDSKDDLFLRIFGNFSVRISKRGHSTHLRVIIGLQKFNIILYDNHVIKIYIFF